MVGEPSRRPRIVIIVGSRIERALIASQLQEEVQCEVASAATFEEGLAQLVIRASLIILDWSNLDTGAGQWEKTRRAARGAPILVLAGSAELRQIQSLSIKASQLLVRPFTVGEVVNRARDLMRGEGANGRADGRDEGNG